MHTETLSIGSELLSGHVIDTNVAFLARELAALGLSIARHSVLGDDHDAVVSFLRDFAGRAERPAALIVTGGLGPTLDDVTREAVAAAFAAPLVEDAASRASIQEMFRRRGLPMAESNLRQALLPRGATPLENSQGTAPGFYLCSAKRDAEHELSQGELHLFCLPGVPAEMKAMFASAALPILRRLAGEGRATVERVLHTFGQGESAVGEQIAAFMAARRNPAVGTVAADGLVSIRLRAEAASADEAAKLLDADEAAIAAILGDILVGRDDERLPQVVARLLIERRATLAVAESCTGGLVSKMLTDVPGASKFFIEAAVTYADESKTSRLGVPPDLLRRHGAVSEPVARAMAEGLRKSAGATYALGTTGIAGPTGGSAEKPVGLVFIALAGPEGTSVARSVFPGDRERVRQRAALAALNLLRLRLQGHKS